MSTAKARLLFYLEEYPSEPWRRAFEAAAPDLAFHTWPDWPDPAHDTATYALVWQPPNGLLASRPDVRAIFSLGAGVDHLTRDPDLPDIPIIRMSDDGLKEGMAEYVLMATLMLQRGMPTLLARQRSRNFTRLFAPSAETLTVGLMGYGALGAHAAATLAPLGYRLKAWSRSPKNGGPVTHYYGSDGLMPFAADCDILIGLLPDTRETRHLINAEFLKALKPGVQLVNAGRGGLIDEAALLDALATGHVAGAVLDVFNHEPLDESSPLWSDPRVIITPHVAAITRPPSAARYVSDMIQTLETGHHPSTLLDRQRGY